MAGLLLALGNRAGWAAARAQKLSPQLVHYPWLITHTFESERFAARMVLHEAVQPVIWQRLKSGAFVAVYGEYYPGDRAIVDSELTAQGLAETARAGRYSELRGDNGLYNLVIYDPDQERVTIANDSIGALLLFRRKLEGGWVWASEPGVLGDGPADEEGLAALLTIGYQPDHRTAVCGVEAMPPATAEVYEWGGENIDMRRESAVSPAENPSGGFTEHYAERLRAAVRLRLDTRRNVTLPLSGGMDSRLLLGLLRETNAPVRTFGLAAGGVRDPVIAQAVAQRAGVPFDAQSPMPGMVEGHLPLLRSALFTTSDWHPALYLPVCGAMREGGEFWLGLFGGTFGGAMVHARNAATGLAAFRANALDPFFGKEASKIAWTVAIPPNIHGAPEEMLVNLYARQRRYTSYLVRLAWNFGRPVCPFADRRLIQLALGSSREQLAEQNSRRRIVVRMIPDLARIPSANDGLPLDSVLRRAYRNGLRGLGIGHMVRNLRSRAYRNYDYCRMDGVAQELWEGLLPVWRPPPGLSVMARLALGPVLLEAEDSTIERALRLVREVRSR